MNRPTSACLARTSICFPVLFVTSFSISERHYLLPPFASLRVEEVPDAFVGSRSLCSALVSPNLSFFEVLARFYPREHCEPRKTQQDAWTAILTV